VVEESEGSAPLIIPKSYISRVIERNPWPYKPHNVAFLTITITSCYILKVMQNLPAEELTEI
jgi:hypothetical protein